MLSLTCAGRSLLPHEPAGQAVQVALAMACENLHAFVPWIAGDNGEQPQVYMCAPLATAAGPGGWWALCGVGRHHHEDDHHSAILRHLLSLKAQAPITLTHLPCIQLTPVFCSRHARLRMRSVNVTCSHGSSVTLQSAHLSTHGSDTGLSGRYEPGSAALLGHSPQRS